MNCSPKYNKPKIIFCKRNGSSFVKVFKTLASAKRAEKAWKNCGGIIHGKSF